MWRWLMRHPRLYVEVMQRVLFVRYAVKARLAAHHRSFVLVRRGVLVMRFLFHRSHEPDFEFFGLTKRRGLFLDVGANIGQSVLSFKLFQPDSPVVSFEPNPDAGRELRLLRFLVRNFRYHLLGASDRDGSGTLYVPTLNRMPLTSEGSLNETTAAQGHGLRRLGNSILEERGTRHFRSRHTQPIPELGMAARQVELRRLDGFGFTPAFVKVDVEGHEARVVRGLTETIDRYRPIILLENNERTGITEIESILAPFGYRPYRWRSDLKHLIPYRAGVPALNVFFICGGDESRLITSG